MKRDIDLARALLFDIEGEGVDCPINRLRAGVAEPVAETSERVRYHLRLLIDAGLVKEVDRTTAGVPCVRLTNAGHELIEVARSDVRWREAKQHTRDATGGLSLTVVRAVLTKWAVEGVSVGRRGYYRGYRSYRPYYYRVEPRRRYEAHRYDLRDSILDEDEPRVIRTRPDYRERADRREQADRYDAWDIYDRDYVAPVDRTDCVADADDAGVGVSLPIYLL